MVPNKEMRMRYENLKYGNGNEHPDLSAEVYRFFKSWSKAEVSVKLDGSTAGSDWMMDAGT